MSVSAKDGFKELSNCHQIKQCCKVTDINYNFITMDVKNESIRIKCFLKRPCLHANETGARSTTSGTVYFMDSSLWSHGLEWNCGEGTEN